MKNKFTTRLLAALMCFVMVFCVACSTETPATNPENNPPSTNDPTNTPPETNDPAQPDSGDSEHPANGAKKIVSQNRIFYIDAEKSSDITFFHYEASPDILMIDNEIIENMLALLDHAKFEITETETTMTIKRSNGATCVIDFVEDSVSFDNFDLFNVYHSNSMSDMLSSTYTDDEGNSIYFKRTDSTDIAGLNLYLDLAYRNIPLDIYEGKKYMPLQTFNDLFFSFYGTNILFNSKDVFLAPGGQIPADLKDEYYSIEPSAKSEALTEFATNEICFLLDLCYGLQDEHGVLVGFDLYLEHTGLLDDLSSTDATASSIAIASLTFGYLADKHSALVTASPYTGSPNFDISQAKIDSSIIQNILLEQTFKAIRAEAMPEGVPGYEEIGNTAYVTFDSFTLDSIRYQAYSEESKEIVDTFGLIIYAHSMITRENSPIENVVLDLSCNGGGAADAAVYVVAWMLGYCDLHLTNPITNSFSTTSYKVDVNLDGVFDEKDSIADKNLYCIISPLSFSCGNLVPSLLKESGKVTLLGGTSGGGACAVRHASTADGTLFQFSSPQKLSVVSNGSYYTVDRGVDPHHFFGKTESYFDRAALTEFINGLK